MPKFDFMVMLALLTLLVVGGQVYDWVFPKLPIFKISEGTDKLDAFIMAAKTLQLAKHIISCSQKCCRACRRSSTQRQQLANT